MQEVINRAIKEKSYYNAQRLVRTETAKAYGDSFFDKILKNNDIVAYQSILSPRHPVPDICDFYANTDLYGLGKGVFPKNVGPEYPYHPNCLCILKPIYNTNDTPGLDESKAVSYIKKLGKDKSKSLFGENFETVVKDPSLWKKYLKGFSEFVNHKTLSI